MNRGGAETQRKTIWSLGEASALLGCVAEMRPALGHRGGESLLGVPGRSHGLSTQAVEQTLARPRDLYRRYSPALGPPGLRRDTRHPWLGRESVVARSVVPNQ